MSKLNVDSKTIKDIFSDKKADFLIPDYQRPYAWGEEESQTLWDDIFSFACPDNNYQSFKNESEYFLGTIVMFKNQDNKQEIIDGQQRLITLMLLLRAFYTKLEKQNDENCKAIKENISKCIWKTTEFDQADYHLLKIDSEVATDEDKKEFLSILESGEVQEHQRSNYANNYKFFQQQVTDLLDKYSACLPYVPARILNNCILLPVEADSQETALKIFSTLNDRGIPLDADIFKSQFYKYYADKQLKEQFITEWKELEKITAETHKSKIAPMDELFTKYMYYIRAKKGTKSNTTEGLRKFYETDKYSLLKNEQTFSNLQLLAEFWKDVSEQNQERFTENILKQLCILHYAPNGMWYYFISTYFLHYRKQDGTLDEREFALFLKKSIAFIWAYTISNPGISALKTPLFVEMINIVNDAPVSFAKYKFNISTIKSELEKYRFSNNRAITKSMLMWWAFQNTQQKLPSKSNFQIEHIYATKRAELYPLKNQNNVDALGNKSILERAINIPASCYPFQDKAKYYNGKLGRGGKTTIQELLDISQKLNDFSEGNIEERNDKIINAFVSYLEEYDLVRNT